MKAIMPVHLYGACADMDAIAGPPARIDSPSSKMRAAIATAPTYKGRRAGSIGTVGCFSFFPTKNLGAFGDGGMLTTNDEALATRLRSPCVFTAPSRNISTSGREKIRASMPCRQRC